MRSRKGCISINFQFDLCCFYEIWFLQLERKLIFHMIIFRLKKNHERIVNFRLCICFEYTGRFKRMLEPTILIQIIPVFLFLDNRMCTNNKRIRMGIYVDPSIRDMEELKQIAL